MPEMWTRFRIRFEFLTPLMAGVPKDPNIIEKWRAGRMPRVKPPEAKSIDDIQQEVLDTIPPAEADEEGEHVFQRYGEGAKKWGLAHESYGPVPDGALIVRLSTFRSHIKESSRLLSRYYIGSVEGTGTFASRIISTLYYPPEAYWVPILRDNFYILQPDDRVQKPIHAMTPMGPISAIKAMEVLWAGCAVEFPLHLLTSNITIKPKRGETGDAVRKPAVTQEDLETVFMFGSSKGYGPERGDGAGRYAWKIERLP